MAYLVDKVWIVYCVTFNGQHLIESVWSTKELAESAALYHQFNSHHLNVYQVIERELNVTVNNG